MAKTPTDKPQPAAADAAPAPAAPAAPMPASGGCWVRNADGTLSRDPAEPIHNKTPADVPAQQE